MRNTRRFCTFLMSLAMVPLVGTGSARAGITSEIDSPAQQVIVDDAASTCSTMMGATVSMAEIGLPTRGAVVTNAELRESADDGTLPQYCELKGSILAAGLLDPPINFQLNLPSSWNGKALQYGGGGLNGLVVSGLGNIPHAPMGSAVPLSRGYLTFGDDSGHQGTPLTAEFGLNHQALANYGGESVKRSHDTALALAQRYYKRRPNYTFFAGGSKGGHEALVAAQRYGSSYDGIIAYYPASQNQAMVLSWFRMWEAAFRRTGGSLDSVERQALTEKVLESCDALDGVLDSIVSNIKGCSEAFEPEALLCSDTVNHDGCLTRTQLDTLETGTEVMQFAFPLANGVTSAGPYPVFEGGDTSVWFDDTGTATKVFTGVTGESMPATASLGGLATSYGIFTDQVIRYFIQQNPAATTIGFDYREWRPRVQELSHLLDATSPNVDAFRSDGGKLLLVQGSSDMLVSHVTTSTYFDSLRARYGQRTAEFAKYYLVPGFAHAGGEFAMTWDSLGALERWVEQGQPPSNPVAIAGHRSRPMCEYPLWPQYEGRGDLDNAASFRCARS